jgi:hypothetical protein
VLAHQVEGPGRNEVDSIVLRVGRRRGAIVQGELACDESALIAVAERQHGQHRQRDPGQAQGSPPLGLEAA